MEAQPDIASSTDDYARRFAGATGAWMLDVQRKAIADLMAPWPDASVLDVGGGHAQVTPPLMAAGHQVMALVSTDGAGDRLRRLQPDANLLVGDINTPPLPDRSVDVAVAVRMMAHVIDWRAFVAQLCRVADKAVIIDFAVDSGANAFSSALFALKKKFEGNTREFASQARADVVACFAENGFAVDGQIGQFVVPMVVHRKLKSPGISGALEGLARPLAPRFGNPVILRATRQEG
ncbi:class I SAM-dependent methyltransferase [Actibacterium ureilyticum]|uniref:class I SAM-dependent methyltransferase n=1 Tax=Actibacterium ureilyticum TaxID=1590614 RepID=UPI000BAAD8B5|nr:methyltransferase domain-containing protein [Actibacterium ureilyticum]